MKGKGSPEYSSWQMMKNRCLNPNAEDYIYYGGRGITIDPAWKRFSAFYIDMGDRPTYFHTLERVDNNLGYSKSNCIWATRETQARNRPQYNKLTKAKADQIRIMYASNKYYQKTLATIFGVSQRTISLITRMEGWK